MLRELCERTGDAGHGTGTHQQICRGYPEGAIMALVVVTGTAAIDRLKELFMQRANVQPHSGTGSSCLPGLIKRVNKFLGLICHTIPRLTCQFLRHMFRPIAYNAEEDQQVDYEEWKARSGKMIIAGASAYSRGGLCPHPQGGTRSVPSSWWTWHRQTAAGLLENPLKHAHICFHHIRHCVGHVEG